MLRKTSLIVTLFCATLSSCSDDNAAVKDSLFSDASLYYQDGEVVFPFEAPDPSKITMVFIGEGYTGEDLARDNGRYEEDALRCFNHLFVLEPFATYRDDFNAAIIYARSDQKEIPNNQSSGRTALGVYIHESGAYDGADIAPYINKLSQDIRTRYNVLIAIRDGIGGNTYLERGGTNHNGNSAYAGSKAVRTMVHEVGHSFGLLGDEYILMNSPHPDPLAVAYANLDFVAVPETVKWNHFINRPGYEKIGLYEGGDSHATGLWRPTRTSIMNGIDVDYDSEFFNAVSREAIVKAIFNLQNRDYAFSIFLANDRENTITRGALLSKTNIPLLCNGVLKD